MATYAEFLDQKSQLDAPDGFAPLWMPEALFPFQQDLVDYALRKGRAALFADTGLGKSAMQLTWAENVVRYTNKRVLVLTPLAVGWQTVVEGAKFGIACARSDGTRLSPITITNYEKLHLFDPQDFVGCVCDESAILKHFTGTTQRAVTRFMSKLPYRLLCTATPAPNDYVELGTSSEALGYLEHSEMLSRFFKQEDKKHHRMNDIKLARDARKGDVYQRLSYRVTQSIQGWRLKGHAQDPFWRWVCSWARACRQPADLGYENGGFALPPLDEQEHVIAPTAPLEGELFPREAFGLKEERQERHQTLQARSEYIAGLVERSPSAIVWVHYNEEGDHLEHLIPGAKQVAGKDEEATREDIYRGFVAGEVRVLVCKPKIGAWGLNLQHCAHVVTMPSHSFEQYYQSIRRCWRFGQTKPVHVDIVTTPGERHVRDNMVRKAHAADAMFSRLLAHMYAGEHLARARHNPGTVQIPAWMAN